MCTVGEVHLGMICSKVAVKFIRAKRELWLEKGTRDSISSLVSRKAGEIEGLPNNSVLQERMQDRRTRDALGLAKTHNLMTLEEEETNTSGSKIHTPSRAGAKRAGVGCCHWKSKILK